jgi:hypothetical protein
LAETIGCYGTTERSMSIRKDQSHPQILVYATVALLPHTTIQAKRTDIHTYSRMHILHVAQMTVSDLKMCIMNPNQCHDIIVWHTVLTPFSVSFVPLRSTIV